MTVAKQGDTASMFIGWIRSDRRSPWRAACTASSYQECERALSELPAQGRREESQVLRQGERPQGRVEQAGR
jgi:hypothetical protein